MPCQILDLCTHAEIELQQDTEAGAVQYVRTPLQSMLHRLTQHVGTGAMLCVAESQRNLPALVGVMLQPWLKTHAELAGYPSRDSDQLRSLTQVPGWAPQTQLERIYSRPLSLNQSMLDQGLSSRGNTQQLEQMLQKLMTGLRRSAPASIGQP